MDQDLSVQEPISTSAASGEPSLEEALLVPLPSTSLISAFRSSSTLTPLICDERAIGRLLETLIHRAGISIEEASRRMGVTSNSVRQYLAGRRRKPSLLWFVRLAGLCGATVTIQFPEKK